MFESPPPVVVSELYKAYHRGATQTPVLRGLSLQVEAGTCAFLVGPSGSGKSTLLSILGCLLTPDHGQVRILGQDLARLDARERTLLRRRSIGFVFQRFQLIRGLNAVENVSVPLTLQGVAPQRAERRASELLAAVGLGDRLRQHPANLSTGQCQRVALARALAGDPQLILADEPTASLDAETGLEVMELLRSLTTARGKTALVVTHDPRIFQFADAVLELQGGRIAAEPKRRAPPLTEVAG
jgi:putative ABC transport system ATP-binding protein